MTVEGKIGWCTRSDLYMGASTTKRSSANWRFGRSQYPRGEESNFVVSDQTSSVTIRKFVNAYCTSGALSNNCACLLSLSLCQRSSLSQKVIHFEEEAATPTLR